MTQPEDAVEHDAQRLAHRTGVRDAGTQRVRRSPQALAPREVWDVIRSPGRPLAARERSTSLAGDHATVRVHTGHQATASARALEADAYTYADHIVLADDASADPRLLHHELAHVGQARRNIDRPLLYRQGTHEPEPGSSGRGFDTTHLLGTFAYHLDLGAGIPGVLPPMPHLQLTPPASSRPPNPPSGGGAAAGGTTSAQPPAASTQTGHGLEPAGPAEVPPQEVGATPYGSSLINTSSINPVGTWTLFVGGGGVASRAPVLSQPPLAGPTVATSPTEWLQLQASWPGAWRTNDSSLNAARVANIQAQLAPPNPFRLNPALIAGVGLASGQQPPGAPNTLTPSALATLILEALIGGPDASHSRFSAAANISAVRTPYANGLLSNVTGITAGGALTLFSDYYHDAPPASSSASPAGITQTPRFTAGIAGSYSSLRGLSVADPTRSGALNTAGIDIFATYVTPLMHVGGTAGRFFVTLTPGVRMMSGEGGGGIGASGMVTIGWLSAGRPGVSPGAPEHP